MGGTHHKRQRPRSRDDEEESLSKFSADALPWPRPCDTVDKYAGDRKTERL